MAAVADADRRFAHTLLDVLGEPQSLAGRTIVITGGTSGTGLAGAVAWHSAGAEILLGARNEKRFDEAAARFPGERVHPFIADLEDQSSVEAGLRALAQSGLQPTDVVHCAAAGLEPILRPLMRTIVGLRRVPPGAERDDAIAREREKLSKLVRENSRKAAQVNLDGSRAVIGHLTETFAPGARVITLSSLWCEGSRTGACPAFYRAVADSKLAFEDWLGAKAGEWSTRDVSVTVLVGHIISDTGSGKLIDRNVVPLMSEGDQLRFRADYVTTAETVHAVTQLLSETSEPSPALRRMYLFGTGGLATSMPAETTAVAGRVPL